MYDMKPLCTKQRKEFEWEPINFYTYQNVFVYKGNLAQGNMRKITHGTQTSTLP